MNCHGSLNNNKDDDAGKKHKGYLSHMLMMALCCGAPVIILLLIPFLINIGGSALAKPLTAIAPFICPIMMVVMIPMMLKGHKKNMGKEDCCQDKTNLQIDQKSLNE
jgi:hypothetical protein